MTGSWRLKIRDFGYAVPLGSVGSGRFSLGVPSARAETLVVPLGFTPLTARTERDSIENKFKKARPFDHV